MNHSAKEYVKGIHYVNSLEGYWSRLKLSIRGTHVHLSGKHLWKYASEFSFRYNTRDVTDLERAALAAMGIQGKRLTYRRVDQQQAAS
ncbi:MAG: transposase [Deltaproteobacteria bacterium]|nr:transposase [Deltaproteobacteria bacterium]